MTDPVDRDLYRRTRALLAPGETALDGVIVHTDLTGEEEVRMTELTVAVGETIADHAAPDADTYVYSGVDDPEFASNQHQGRTLDDEEFVWECQTLLRDGTFDLVFYYRADAGHGAILADLRAEGHEVTGVRGPHADGAGGGAADGDSGPGDGGGDEDGAPGPGDRAGTTTDGGGDR